MDINLERPLLDQEVMRELMGVTADSGSGYMVQLFQVFVTDAAKGLERMRQLARQGDAASLARAAHRLKGASATVGAARLAGQCHVIDRTARGGSCAGLELTIAGAFDVLDATRVAAAEFFRGTIAKAA